MINFKYVLTRLKHNFILLLLLKIKNKNKQINKTMIVWSIFRVENEYITVETESFSFFCRKRKQQVRIVILNKWDIMPNNIKQYNKLNLIYILNLHSEAIVSNEPVKQTNKQMNKLKLL